jgi:hypothetical protein
MKIPCLRLIPLALAGLAAPLSLPAQSEAASTHASRAVHASGTASVETLAAGAHAVVGSIRVASGIAAVPLWFSGAALTGAGHVSQEAGRVAVRAGQHTTGAADDFWRGTANPPPAPLPCATPRRPPLDRQVGLPVGPRGAPSCDPAPAEAFRRVRTP